MINDRKYYLSQLNDIQWELQNFASYGDVLDLYKAMKFLTSMLAEQAGFELEQDRYEYDKWVDPTEK